MLRILDRYILREISAPFAIGIVAFTFFALIDRAYQLTDLIITKGVPLRMVLGLLALMLPSFLTLTLPMALLVATLLACHRLSNDQEITGLKASGVSPWRLFRPLLAAALLVTAVVAWITLVVNPWSYGAIQQQLARILQARAVSGIKERVFNATFPKFLIYVEEVSVSQVELRGLLVADERDPALTKIFVARGGRLLTDQGSGRATLRLIDGAVSETHVPSPSRFRLTTFGLYDMALPIESARAALSRLERRERDLPLLALFRKARQQGKQRVAPEYVELHKRFALPFVALVFVMVGYPLGILSQRTSRGTALAVSLGIAVSYCVMFSALEGMALHGLVPAGVGMWIPNLLFGSLGASLLVATIGRYAGPCRFVGRFAEPFSRRTGRRGVKLEDQSSRHPATSSARTAALLIIDRYVLSEYLKYLGAGVAVGAVLFFVVDLMHTFDRFLLVGASFRDMFLHFAYRLPGMLYQGLPMIVLIAVVFLFLSLTRNRELEAFQAAGLSLYRVSLPLLVPTLIISLAAVTFQETCLPGLNARAEEFDRAKIQVAPANELQRQGPRWHRVSETRFLRMGEFDPSERFLNDLLIVEVDRSFRMLSRLDARNAQWTPEGWELSAGAFQAFEPTRTMRLRSFDSAVFQIPERIDDFVKSRKSPSAMSFRELRAFVMKLQENGYQVAQYIVELYSKLSFPVAHFVLALVAIPFALLSQRNDGRAIGIGVAIVVSLGYWVVHSLALSFAKAELLPPMLAAWTANIAFAGLGAALFLRVRT